MEPYKIISKNGLIEITVENTNPKKIPVPTMELISPYDYRITNNVGYTKIIYIYINLIIFTNEDHYIYWYNS